MQLLRCRQRLFMVQVHRQREGLLRVSLIVKLLLLVQQRLIVARQLFRRNVVLARQRDLTGDTLLQLKKTVRVEIQTLTVVAKFVTGFRDLNGRLFQHIQDARQFAVHADQFGKQLTDVIQLALKVNVFAIRQQVERILAD